MFNEYELNGRIIHATKFAFETIYRAQGYKLQGEDNETSTDIQGGSSSADNGTSNRLCKKRGTLTIKSGRNKKLP